MKKVYLVMGRVNYEGSDVLRAYERDCDATTCMRSFRKIRRNNPDGELGVYDDFYIKEMELLNYND